MRLLLIGLAITSLGAAETAIQDIRLSTGWWPEPNDTITYDATDGAEDAGDYTYEWHRPRHLGLAYARSFAAFGPVLGFASIEGSYTDAKAGGRSHLDSQAEQRVWALRLMPGIAWPFAPRLHLEASPTVGWQRVRLHWINPTDYIDSGWGDGLEIGGRLAAFATMDNGLQVGIDLRYLRSETTVEIDYGDDLYPYQNYDHVTKTDGWAVLVSLGYRH